MQFWKLYHYKSYKLFSHINLNKTLETSKSSRCPLYNGHRELYKKTQSLLSIHLSGAEYGYLETV